VYCGARESCSLQRRYLSLKETLGGQNLKETLGGQNLKETLGGQNERSYFGMH